MSGKDFLVRSDLRHKNGYLWIPVWRLTWHDIQSPYVCILWQGTMSCPMSAACIQVWQHIGRSTTATSRHHHNMTSDVKATLNPTNNFNCFRLRSAIWLRQGSSASNLSTSQLSWWRFPHQIWTAILFLNYGKKLR